MTNEKYKLYHGDCLEVMKSLPAGSVDAVICDLPYGTTACAWDTVIPFSSLWEAYRRVVKKNGGIILTASQPFTTCLIASNMQWFKYCWVWDKNNSAGFATAKYRPFIITEDICVFGRGSIVYNPQKELRGRTRRKGYGGSRSDCYSLTPIKGEENNSYFPKNILHFSKVNQIEDLHPSQKPETLMAYLVRTYTNEGDTVLDNTMGSGTTGVACMQTGRNFIGIEIDPTYYAIAEKRIRDAASQELLRF